LGEKRRRDAEATDSRRGDLADMGRSVLRPYMIAMMVRSAVNG